jgi:N-acetylglucosamine-6-phosphate deacetylase
MIVRAARGAVVASPSTIAAAGLVSAGRQRTDAVVELAHGRVTGIRDQVPGERYDVVLPDGVLVPGLVDMQINGCFGIDLAAATPSDWAMVAARLPETGVTAFAPTFISAPVAELAASLRRLAAVHATPPAGSRVLGAHVEGPFLSEARRGAHDPAYLCDPTPDAVRALIEAGPPGTLAMVTLAPERAHAIAAIKRLRDAGVTVSVGHSDATAAQVAAAADAGARAVTHLFNAQRPLHHREPGVPGHALVDDRLALGLIVDLHHVAADVVLLAFRAAGERIVLVTDAVASAGMPPGRYALGGEPLLVESGRPPVREDGVIAGSGLRLDEAVRNTVDLGVPLTTAVDAATRRPADLLGRADLGRIEPGAPADLAWLGPDLLTRATWVAGTSVYGRGRDSPAGA